MDARSLIEQAPTVAPPRNPDEPAPFPETCLQFPVGTPAEAMREYILASATRRQPRFAVVGALALIAAVAGRRYRVATTGARPNAMFVMVAGPGAGKDAPRQCLKRVLIAAEAEHLLGGEDLASGAALVARMGDHPVSLFLIDEYGLVLRAATDPNAPAYRRELVTEFLRLFSESQGTYLGREYADRRHRQRVEVKNPILVLLGATTPSTFDAALSSRDASSGLLPRLLVVPTDRSLPPLEFGQKPAEPPAPVVEWCRAVLERPGPDGNLNPSAALDPLRTPPVTPVEMTGGAEQILAEFARRCDEEARGAQADEAAMAIWVRGFEQAQKVALLLAINANFERPVIDHDSARWACDFVAWCAGEMVRRLKAHIADNPHDALLKRFMRAVRGCSRYAGDKRFGAACARGWLPRGKALGVLAIDKFNMDRVAEAAREAGLIEVVEGDPSVHGYAGIIYGALDSG